MKWALVVVVLYLLYVGLFAGAEPGPSQDSQCWTDDRTGEVFC